MKNSKDTKESNKPSKIERHILALFVSIGYEAEIC